MTCRLLQSSAGGPPGIMSYKFKESVPPFDDCEDDPVGILEVASRLGVQDRSVHMMRRRDRLPEPDYDSINGSRAWHWRTILWWAGETGRLYSTSLENEYRVTFGLEPPIVVNGRHLSGLVMRPDPHAEQPKVPANPKKAAG